MRSPFELLFPDECLGCGRLPRLLCSVCTGATFVHPRPLSRQPLAETGWPAWSFDVFDGLPASVLRAVKDHSLTAALEPLYAQIVDGFDRLPLFDAFKVEGVGGAGVGKASVGALLVPIPGGRNSWRRRGFNLPTMLAKRLARDCRRPAAVSASLGHARGIADQRGLGTSARAANLAGSMVCDPALLGRELTAILRSASRVAIVVVDDVATTGATLAEAHRALAAALMVLPAFAEQHGTAHGLGAAPAHTVVSGGFLVLAETLLKNDHAVTKWV